MLNLREFCPMLLPMIIQQSISTNLSQSTDARKLSPSAQVKNMLKPLRI
jgi:hypothetical protein